MALALALLVAAAAQTTHARAVALIFAGLIGVAWWWQARLRRTLVLDDDGWAIEERGCERLRVRWHEVRTVRVDAAEHALYVDCGDPARNLLVPPARGYGFRFADAEALCAGVLARVPAERVTAVERLEAAPPPAAP